LHSDGSSLKGVNLREPLGEHSAIAPHVDLGVDDEMSHRLQFVPNTRGVGRVCPIDGRPSVYFGRTTN
jgi:hypothetical protein